MSADRIQTTMWKTERNRLLYGQPGRKFLHLDIVHDALAKADLILAETTTKEEAS